MFLYSVPKKALPLSRQDIELTLSSMLLDTYTILNVLMCVFRLKWHTLRFLLTFLIQIVSEEKFENKNYCLHKGFI